MDLRPTLRSTLQFTPDPRFEKVVFRFLPKKEGEQPFKDELPFLGWATVVTYVDYDEGVYESEIQPVVLVADGFPMNTLELNQYHEDEYYVMRDAIVPKGRF